MKDGISEYKRPSLVNDYLKIFQRQQIHMSAVTDKHATIVEQLKTVFSIGLLPWLRKEE
jgi:hypothetical protein